jgi:hypothetical protein
MIKCARIEIFLTKPMFGRALEAATHAWGELWLGNARLLGAVTGRVTSPPS